MTFIHPLLLGGLLLAGIPVLLHLIMQQKPKHLLFPAFRFLVQRHRTNQRRLKLRHLLLLALRVLLLAFICLALARPKVFSEGLNLGGQQPVAAVLIFDTSFSMEYTAGGRSRLDEVKTRALELLAELPEGSRIAVLDTTLDATQPSGEWLSPSQARDRIDTLRLRPDNAPVSARVAEAYRLLADLEREQDSGDAKMPRFLYVFSDRTDAAWDQGRVKDLQPLREKLGEGVNTVFVDVGVDNPTNLAIVSLTLRKQVLTIDDKLVVEVAVRAVGADAENVLICRIDEEVTPERKEVKLAAGQSRVITFERSGLPVGPHRIAVTLGGTDALAFDNARFATCEVRGGRRVLTIADNPDDAVLWKLALEARGAFRCEVLSTADAGKLDDVGNYQAVCLLNVAEPNAGLWTLLERYAGKGGGLVILPGGGELKLEAYNDDETAKKVMPGRLVKIVSHPKDSRIDWDWDNSSIYQHPLLKAFQEWRRIPDTDFVRYPRGASSYWEVQTDPERGEVRVTYADKEKRPAIVQLSPKATRGRVLLFTTTMDGRKWNNYVESQTSFYLVLAQLTGNYLAGDAEEANFNYQSGQFVTVPVPLKPRYPTYTLEGPGLSGTQGVVPRREDQADLEIMQAVMPGTYTVYDGDTPLKRVGQFSVNVPPEESQLGRVPVEQIEALFGPGSVVPVEKRTNLRDALQNRWGQPIELLPWLLILVLLILAVENLLANKFYRGQPAENDAKPERTGEAAP